MANLLYMHFRKTNLASRSEINFDSNMLKLLMVIDENKSIREIIGEVNMAPADFKESLIKLIKFKLIEQVDVAGAGSYVGESFMARLRDLLVELTGPLGEVLIEDTAEEMNLDATKIPRSRVNDFVYNLAGHVPGEKQKSKFNSVMTEEIKRL